LSLTKTIENKKIRFFQKGINKLCNTEKKQILHLKTLTTAFPDRFLVWNLHYSHKKLVKLQEKIEKLINKYATKKRTMDFIPLITLTFPAKAAHLEKMNAPVQKLEIDKLTILKQEKKGTLYNIQNYVKLV
jgi:2'-5' RNA ligase